jgi:hypothetical protein
MSHLRGEHLKSAAALPGLHATIFLLQPNAVVILRGSLQETTVTWMKRPGRGWHVERNADVDENKKRVKKGPWHVDRAVFLVLPVLP